MLTTPLFAVTRGNHLSKKLFHYFKLRSYIVWLIMASIITLGLLVSEHRQFSFIEASKVQLMDLSSPFLRSTSQAVFFIKTAFSNLRNLFETYERNKILLEENQKLRQWQELAQRLLSENQVLKKQLRIVEEKDLSLLTARILTYPSGAFGKNILINAGLKDGIKKGQPVLASNAVLGRVIEVGNTTARVLLITDITSRIPVILELSRTQAIIAGTNTCHLRLIHTQKEEPAKVQQRVITSGIGGIFPPGLLVGILKPEDTHHTVTSPIEWSRLEYVHILTSPSLSVPPNR